MSLPQSDDYTAPYRRDYKRVDDADNQRLEHVNRQHGRAESNADVTNQQFGACRPGTHRLSIVCIQILCWHHQPADDQQLEHVDHQHGRAESNADVTNQQFGACRPGTRLRIVMTSPTSGSGHVHPALDEDDATMC